MKKIRIGFTLVEVSLFLAITAAIFVGVAVGTSNSIFQQRYNDSVQSFVEFLRTVYSQVTNVQSGGTGNSDKAIYGKLVTFDEDSGKNVIKTYNVKGDINIDNSCSGPILEQLRCLHIEADTSRYVGEYTPRWGSQIQTMDPWSDASGGYTIFTGSLLIVRSPESGSVYTYFSDNNELEGGEKIKIKDDSGNNLFNSDKVDFCINPNGADKSNLRRDIRLTKNARNASGIEVIGDAGNQCQ